ncbi:hypothetical protein V6Z11_A10G089600 [Gossypium hirsutum]|uniref:Uncharacterized protein n=1 Tax=Gossypium darwinii TaxID=34276 RepID=A0A5D2EZX7_GOSDA|nr:hypothetical protein ES288_A10G092700v1 [Gossypium darwinii]
MALSRTTNLDRGCGGRALAGLRERKPPTATNYDVGSPSWGDLKAAPLPSAMEVTALGHESS